MKRKQIKKSASPLPSWIIVSCSDPKLKQATENYITNKLAEPPPAPKENK